MIDYLYSVLVQVESSCQLLPQLDTWITVHLKHRLQYVHLQDTQGLIYIHYNINKLSFWIKEKIILVCLSGCLTDWLIDGLINYLAVGEGSSWSASDVPVWCGPGRVQLLRMMMMMGMMMMMLLFRAQTVSSVLLLGFDLWKNNRRAECT